MKEPVLVIMAAGMGSRYGGLKQIDPIDEQGNIIIDYSIYDAKRAGFKKVVFIIKKEDEADFRKVIGNRIEKQIETDYVYQDLSYLPQGYKVPENRVKPWGTGHAVLCCSEKVEGPFAVINADDYYGAHAFNLLYQFLSNQEYGDYSYMMVGYFLKNTLTENGYVARGVCSVDENHHLYDIKERTHIERRNGEIQFTEDEAKTFTTLSKDCIVSMNMWGFQKSFLTELKERFIPYLQDILVSNPLKGEYFLPSVVNELIKEKKAEVTVLQSMDKWYGVTYHQDKETVAAAIKDMKKRGVYKEMLWEE